MHNKKNECYEYRVLGVWVRVIQLLTIVYCRIMDIKKSKEQICSSCFYKKKKCNLPIEQKRKYIVLTGHKLDWSYLSWLNCIQINIYTKCKHQSRVLNQNEFQPVNDSEKSQQTLILLHDRTCSFFGFHVIRNYWRLLM